MSKGIEMLGLEPPDSDSQPPEDMSEEDLAAMREARSEMRLEGAGERPSGDFEGQPPEGAGERPSGGAGFRGGNVIVRALVDLLAARAGE